MPPEETQNQNSGEAVAEVITEVVEVREVAIDSAAASAKASTAEATPSLEATAGEEIPAAEPKNDDIEPMDTQEPTEPASQETEVSEGAEVPSGPPEGPTVAPDPTPVNIQNGPNYAHLWARFLDKITGRKARRLEKIMDLAQKRKEIKNDDVEKLLRVSDKTAERYLKELVSQGRLKQVGERGRNVRYELI